LIPQEQAQENCLLQEEFGEQPLAQQVQIVFED
jgi:hypothetical protein